MSQPIWRKIVSDLVVPEAGNQWALAVEVVPTGKLMMIEANGQWTPDGEVNACGPDGFFTNAPPAPGAAPSKGAPLVDSAPRGALIARIGGSTADQKGDASGAANPSRLLFSVGRKCIFSVPDKPVGSLFFAVNDDPIKMAGVNGNLTVNVYEAI